MESLERGVFSRGLKVRKNVTKCGKVLTGGFCCCFLPHAIKCRRSKTKITIPTLRYVSSNRPFLGGEAGGSTLDILCGPSRRRRQASKQTSLLACLLVVGASPPISATPPSIAIAAPVLGGPESVRVVCFTAAAAHFLVAL
jgi:hypothetical protein